ncbi:hypothetical protein [Bythopirellula polymerisocia]|uniref:Uncharacterized protein n=1 Tax=Bythopirellula polymerisocia TaxID=2528003 RepID=A0A5C6D1J7_9BACT|nr:hypothetical protein [Bythopirellula polymerisocia]TWU29704.1 hypothetical protein Pla144_04830 [Bythopirellula polymerisocia]
MAGRIILAALFSAIAMFFWGFVYWGLSGATEQVLGPLPESAQGDIAAVLRRDKVPSGMYVYPMPANPNNADEVEAAEELHLAGPRFLLAHRLEGSEMMAPSVMAAGIGHMFVIALVAAILTACALPVLDTFGKRFGFVALAALLGVLWSNPGDMIWWLHSPAFCVGKMIYGGVGGLLMAAFIAGIVRRPVE